MVSRRALLAGALAAGTTTLAGCASAKTYVSCHYDGDEDMLELAVVPRREEGFVVEYEMLAADAKAAVEAATRTAERYTECHEFEGEGSGIAQLYDSVEQRWNEAGVADDPPRDETFLRYDGTYHGIRLFLLDVGKVHSLPE